MSFFPDYEEHPEYELPEPLTAVQVSVFCALIGLMAVGAFLVALGMAWAR